MSQKTKRILIPILASLVVAAGGVAITAQFPEITGTVAEAASVSVEDSDTSKEEDFGFNSNWDDDGKIKSYNIISYRGTASNVIIPDTYNGKPVTGIGWNAFKNNTTITRITIPESIERIDDTSFKGCTNLTSITLPQYSKLDYWSNPFRNMPGDVFENASITYYERDDGTLKITGAIGRVKEGETLVIPKYINGKKVVAVRRGVFQGCAGVKKVELADGFKTVGRGMFIDARELEEVILPNSITSVNQEAFVGCSSLQTIVLPKQLKEIGWAAFYGCSSLRSIELPEGVSSIEGRTFEDCSSLKSITLPQGVKKIGKWAFENCSSLEEISLPSEITQVSRNSFYGCSALKKITFTSSDAKSTPYSKANWRYLLRNLRKDAVFTNGCLRYREDMTDGTPSITIIDYVGSDKTVTIPESIDGKPVTRIKSYAFHGNEYVEKIIVPDSVTEIQGDAFKNCAKLKTVKLSKNLKGLYHCTFKNCPSLTDVTIPEGVTFIGTTAFQDCTALQKIEIPASVKKLKDGAFQGCTRLSEVTLHNGLLYLSFDAFNGCTDLQHYSKLHCQTA